MTPRIKPTQPIRPTQMTQEAFFPVILEKLVQSISYKDRWNFSLSSGHYDRGQGCKGLTLTISVRCDNSHAKTSGHPRAKLEVAHLFPVPPAAFNYESWRRWVFDRILDVETHEAMEFFEVDKKKPYAPNHGPGEDPYIIRELATIDQRKTNWKGEPS